MSIKVARGNCIFAWCSRSATNCALSQWPEQIAKREMPRVLHRIETKNQTRNACVCAASALQLCSPTSAMQLLRSGLNNVFIFSKLREARSRLYRRQMLQVNTRLKALDEIYKIYTLLDRSVFKISAKFRQTFSHFHSFTLSFSKFHWFFQEVV